ncbi:MFS transporter [Comamonas sp. NLF-1-9]|uniref:MFS transporter n=1 Tax=Comamonas sp. NLF-1-9 TaxID=2853163 RepID=UPI001C485605|nr:MFS transporter [Comamonas sp. NLF-1-9]QXL83894.1 MFS transporter [Comamonas sp. NLF-1-9]
MPPAATATLTAANPTRYRVLGAISFSHMLNDMIQSLILAIYPILKGDFNLSFLQIGLITLTYQLTASMLQPLVGLYTDKHPKPHSLAFGMGSTLCGLLLLSIAPNFAVILLAAALVGTGSSVFHPESSRIARLASGGQHGLAQSIFQVGGNTGSALGPLLAALIVLPQGQGAIAWFALAALVAIAVLWQIGNWYQRQFLSRPAATRKVSEAASPVPQRLVVRAIAVLLVLIFSKYFYLTSITSYYTFYLIHHFGVSVQASQIHLFVFLFAVAAGTLAGGPIGDRIGRKPVIWVSILGVAPFTLALPHVNLMWTGILIFIIGLVIASAFSAILVYAQELMPGKIGAVSGMFFGFAFGMGGIGAAVLGVLADSHGIEFVYQICAFLPLLGLLTIFLPTIEHPRRKAA